MDLDVFTGMSAGQRVLLVVRCVQLCGPLVKEGGRPVALGLSRSVMLLVCLMRKNITQEMVGAIFGVSQLTVSRRRDLLRPIIERVMASFIPHRREIAGPGTLPVAGTVTPN